jgi:hypothetical protein
MKFVPRKEVEPVAVAEVSREEREEERSSQGTTSASEEEVEEDWEAIRAAKILVRMSEHAWRDEGSNSKCDVDSWCVVG